jgi:hypothetical protein
MSTQRLGLAGAAGQRRHLRHYRALIACPVRTTSGGAAVRLEGVGGNLAKN